MLCLFVLQDNLRFPDDVTNVSAEARDLIMHLITTPEQRLGQNGIQEFKDHPFFNGIDWDRIRNSMFTELVMYSILSRCALMKYNDKLFTFKHHVLFCVL